MNEETEAGRLGNLSEATQLMVGSRKSEPRQADQCFSMLHHQTIMPPIVLEQKRLLLPSHAGPCFATEFRTRHPKQAAEAAQRYLKNNRYRKGFLICPTHSFNLKHTSNSP